MLDGDYCYLDAARINVRRDYSYLDTPGLMLDGDYCYLDTARIHVRRGLLLSRHSQD